MTKKQEDILKSLNVNLEETMSRFLNKEDFYFRFLKQLPDDPNYDKLVQSMTEGNFEEAFKNAHTLRGLSLNLGLNNMGRVAGELTECLRHPPYDEEKALSLYEDFKIYYGQALQGIAEL